MRTPAPRTREAAGPTGGEATPAPAWSSGGIAQAPEARVATVPAHLPGAQAHVQGAETERPGAGTQIRRGPAQGHEAPDIRITIGQIAVAASPARGRQPGRPRGFDDYQLSRTYLGRGR